jgi:hypothetical protein
MLPAMLLPFVPGHLPDFLPGLSAHVLNLFGLLPHGKPMDGATFIQRKLFQPSSYSCR